MRRQRKLSFPVWFPPTLHFGMYPAGSRCAVCRLMHPLARVSNNYVTVYLCMSHARWWDAQGQPPRPSVRLGEDPRPIIERYQKEGFILKDMGCVIVEQFRHIGPAFVTEIRTVDGKFSVCCVNPSAAIGRTPEEFIEFRLNAILMIIRKMVAEDVPA